MAAVESQLMAKESESLAAAMRAERAETSAVAAQNELLEVTKRYGSRGSRRPGAPKLAADSSLSVCCSVGGGTDSLSE